MTQIKSLDFAVAAPDETKAALPAAVTVTYPLEVNGGPVTLGGTPVTLEILPRDTAEWQTELEILQTKYPSVFQFGRIDQPDMTDEQAVAQKASRQRAVYEMAARAIRGWSITSGDGAPIAPTVEERVEFITMGGDPFANAVSALQNKATEAVGNSQETSTDGPDTSDT